MMRLYLDTSVLGALTDREDERRVAVTRRLLRGISGAVHEGVISNVVQEELEAAPEHLRSAILREIRRVEFELAVEDAESRILFAEYVGTRVVPMRFRNDLRHVAVATKARADALVSWNFRHLVNVRTRRAVHAVHLRLGYPLIEIVSPEEV
jgi:predicted nucleic acid-binding protein